jgi:hypothetical protein
LLASGVLFIAVGNLSRVLPATYTPVVGFALLAIIALAIALVVAFFYAPRRKRPKRAPLRSPVVARSLRLPA